MRTAYVHTTLNGVRVAVYGGVSGLLESRCFVHEKEAHAFLEHSGWRFDVDDQIWREPTLIVPAWTAVPRPALFEWRRPAPWYGLDLQIMIYRFETWGTPAWAFCYGLKEREEVDPVLGVLSVPPLRIEGIGGFASGLDATGMAETFLGTMEKTYGRGLFAAAVHCYARGHTAPVLVRERLGGRTGQPALGP